MATEEQIESLLDTAGQTQGPTITLNPLLSKKAKIPLSFEEMQNILKSGQAIPQNRSLPTGLSMQQYQQLPGGLAAYTGTVEGSGMIESIKETAGFGTGAGGTEGESESGVDSTDEGEIFYSCPQGYRYDSTQKTCVPIPLQDKQREREEEDYALEMRNRSYNSFADMVMKDNSLRSNTNPTYDDFKQAAGNTWMGGAWEYLFNDTDLLKGSFESRLGTAGQMSANYIPRRPESGNPLQGGKEAPDFAISLEQSQQQERGTAGQMSANYNYVSPQERGTAGQMFANQNVNKRSEAIDRANKEAEDEELNKGGLVKMQEGGEVPVEPPIQGMPVPSGQPAGFVEDPMAQPAPETPVDALMGQGQADDVLGELPEGTFVINAMAVQLAGIDELDKMIETAYEALSKNMREKGIDERLVTQLVGSSRVQAGMKDDMVNVAVSNGEYIVPPEIVPIIGEDKLRKINDRGLKKLEKQKEQKPKRMDEGGFVIATDKDGKILTEKTKEGKSRILSRDEKAQTDAIQKVTQPQTLLKKAPFVRQKTPDEMVEENRKSKLLTKSELNELGNTFLEGERSQGEGPETVLPVPDTGGGVESQQFLETRGVQTNRFSELEPMEMQLRRIELAYRNNDSNKLKEIMDNSSNFSQSSMLRARELMLQLEEGRTYATKTQEEKTVDARIKDNLLSEAELEQLSQDIINKEESMFRKEGPETVLPVPDTGLVSDTGGGVERQRLIERPLEATYDEESKTYSFVPESQSLELEQPIYSDVQGPDTSDTEPKQNFRKPFSRDMFKSFFKDRFDKELSFKEPKKKRGFISTAYASDLGMGESSIKFKKGQSIDTTDEVQVGELLYKLMLAESGGDTTAKSFSDAVGVFQLRESIFGVGKEGAKEFGIRAAETEEEFNNLRWQFNTAYDYLKALLNKFNGDVERAILSYNIGHNYIGQISKGPMTDKKYDELEMIIRDGIKVGNIVVKGKNYNTAKRIVDYSKPYIDKIITEGPLRNPPPMPVSRGFKSTVEPPVNRPKQRAGGFV